MTKEELIKVFSAYLPYDLKVCTSYGSPKLNNPKIMYGSDIDRISRNKNESFVMKPILYDLSHLTKDELRSAGFDCHIDYLTHERIAFIVKYGFENYINKLPHGHFKYLVSKHYNVFGLQRNQFINKASLKQ